MGLNSQYWRGRRVLVTGHTGFKGAWLCLRLHSLGAKVTGVALPADEQSLFVAAKIASVVNHFVGDINDFDRIRDIFVMEAPQVVFHLAAQSLVLRSYKEPLLTFATNVIGTANVLEAARFVSDVEAVVVATSDKCYANRDDAKPFSEGDPLGGDDPYSASKGATELVTHAWRQSFFDNKSLASVRAGNVIGGGDWATDRLIPDLMRGFIQGRQVEIRAPSAIRPWQHVLEPLQGYLMLAERLSLEPTRFAESWNFGPDPDAMITVERLANRLVTLWGDGADWRMVAEEGAAHEAHTLLLDSQKSRSKLGWKPVWSLDEGMAATVRWYKAHVSGEDMRVFTERQIKDYESVC